jgi:hypothetical protein
VEARDIYALRFGTPGAAPLLLISAIHADEVMPREAAMTLARDLAETAHPWATLLASRELWIVPTPNPDRLITQRNNANNEDLNRHYLDYDADAPETRLLVDLIYDLMPVGILDCHEWNGDAGPAYIGTSDQTWVDPALRAATIATGEAMRSAVLAAGASSCAWYPRITAEGSVTHLGAALGIPTMLMETGDVDYGNTSLFAARHDKQLVAMTAWLDHLADHTSEFETLATQVRARTAAKIGQENYWWAIHHHAPIPTGSWATGDNGVAAVDASGYAGVSSAADDALAAHGISHPGGVVSLDHDRAHIATYLLDPLGVALGGGTRTPPPTVIADITQPVTPANQLWSSVVT